MTPHPTAQPDSVEETRPGTAPQSETVLNTDPQTGSQTQETLVEEVSIDGMCGVY